MAVLEITKLPTKTLREPSEEMTMAYFDDASAVEAFRQDLVDSMYAAEGIGIASSQVGKNLRLCIIGKEAIPKRITMQQGDIPRNEDLLLVNPTFERTGKKTINETEGCLSVPKTYGKVKRYKDIHVQALDKHGKTLEFDASNFFARVIQHEVDHLNGILFVDRARDVYEVE